MSRQFCLSPPFSSPNPSFSLRLSIFCLEMQFLLDFACEKWYNVCMGTRGQEKTCPKWCLCRVFDSIEPDGLRIWDAKENDTPEHSGKTKSSSEIQRKTRAEKASSTAKRSPKRDGTSRESPEGGRKGRRPQKAVSPG